MGVEELWTGATSDTEYQQATGIFKKQQRFAGLFDLVDDKVLPFCNILDKEYMINIPE